MEATNRKQGRALGRSIAWIGVLALTFGGTEVATALVVGDVRLLVAGLATASVAVGASVAKTRAARGALTSASLILAYHLLALCVVATVALPFTYTVLLVTTLMAVALALPYARGRALHVLLWIAGGAATGIVGFGATFERDFAPAWWIELLTDIGGGIAGALLVLQLLGHFSDRLWSVVEDNARLLRNQQQLSHMREEFLIVVAHELKTPLTTLGLLLSLIVRDAESGRGPATPESVLAKVHRAEQQGRRLAELVDRLLDVTRADSGRFELRRAPIDLAQLVQEVVSHFSLTLKSAGTEIRLTLEPGVVGRWDRDRIEQVITNLFTNALRYSSGKPITLTVQRIDEGARLTVRDQGVGIAPEDQERIFQPFERAASVRHYGGLGLGLWFSRVIVAEHGGSIRVTSAPGAGATFVVELPLGAASAEISRPYEAQL